jgi:hypothetical protein
MAVQAIDAGKALHSPSAALMELINVHKPENKWSDFHEIVKFLEENLDKVIDEVHHGFDKLLIDNGHTQLNCPPPPEPGDNHGSLLLRALSEQETGANHSGIVVRREFRVHDCGPSEEDSDTSGAPTSLHWIEIRENVVRAPAKPGEPPSMLEHVAMVQVRRNVK